MTITPATTSPFTKLQNTEQQREGIRSDFQHALERKLESWLGRPGSPERARVEKMVGDLMTEPDQRGVRHLDLSKLNDEKKAELKKLQKASEDFEAVFVKRLLSQMRKTSFSEDIGPMGDLAKDMMDQALAESLSRSQNSIGIAKTVFIDMAQRIVRTSDLALGTQRLETEA